jgi:uncharacterized heparinase superfamily protein
MLRHEDGALALFNGMGATRADVLATLLAYEDSAAGSLGFAPQSGYLRLVAGDAALIADVGAAPPRAFSTQAHAGALSFELTVGGHRLIVNCGAPQRNQDALVQAARQTAAHSTLTLDDTSCARFAPTQALAEWLDEQILAGPTRVDVARHSDGSVIAEHDGYVRRFGLTHRRRFALTQRALHVVDELRPAGRRPAAAAPALALRLHLHPSVRCAASPSGGGVLIEPPGGGAWVFHCDDETARLDESVFFAGQEGPRPTRQIVVEREAGALRPLVWRLERLRH